MSENFLCIAKEKKKKKKNENIDQINRDIRLQGISW